MKKIEGIIHNPSDKNLNKNPQHSQHPQDHLKDHSQDHLHDHPQDHLKDHSQDHLHDHPQDHLKDHSQHAQLNPNNKNIAKHIQEKPQEKPQNHSRLNSSYKEIAQTEPTIVPSKEIVSSKDYASRIVDLTTKFNALSKSKNQNKQEAMEQISQDINNIYIEANSYYLREVIDNEIAKIEKNKSTWTAVIVIFCIMLIVAIIVICVIFIKKPDSSNTTTDDIYIPPINQIGCKSVDTQKCIYGPTTEKYSNCKMKACINIERGLSIIKIVNTTYGECVPIDEKCSYPNNSCFNYVAENNQTCNTNCNNNKANNKWPYTKNAKTVAGKPVPSAYQYAWTNTYGGKCVTKCPEHSGIVYGTVSGYCKKNCKSVIVHNQNADDCHEPYKISYVNVGNTAKGSCNWDNCPNGPNGGGNGCADICKSYITANGSTKQMKLTNPYHDKCTSACSPNKTTCTTEGNGFICTTKCKYPKNQGGISTPKLQCNDLRHTCKYTCKPDCDYGTNTVYTVQNPYAHKISKKTCNLECNYQKSVNTQYGRCLPISEKCVMEKGRTVVGAYFKNKKSHGCVTTNYCYTPIDSNQLMCKPGPVYTDNKTISGVAVGGLHSNRICALPQVNMGEPVACYNDNYILKDCKPFSFTQLTSKYGETKVCKVACEYPGVSHSNGDGKCTNTCPKIMIAGKTVPHMTKYNNACCKLTVGGCNSAIDVSIGGVERHITCSKTPELCIVSTGCLGCVVRPNCSENGLSKNNLLCRTSRAKIENCSGKVGVLGPNGIHGANCYTYNGVAKQCISGVNFNFTGCNQQCGNTANNGNAAICRQWTQAGKCMSVKAGNYTPKCINTTQYGGHEILSNKMCYVSNIANIPNTYNARYCNCKNGKQAAGCHQKNLNIIFQPFLGNQANHCDTKYPSKNNYGLGYHCKNNDTVLRTNKCTNCNQKWASRMYYQVNGNSCGNTGDSQVIPVATWALYYR